MNYFAHAYRFLDDPYFAAGTGVPDWLAVADRNVRVRQKHAEPLTEDPDVIPVVFDGTGVEIYLKGKVGKWGIIGGYIDYDPDTERTPLDPDFRTRYLILGADWQISEGTGVYTEFRIDDSVGAEGQESSSVGVLGLKYRFSWKSTHNP